MSCFSGSFAALPGVRCDRFQRLNGGGGMTIADQFFLSHCHTDHMVGLDELGRFLRQKARGSRLNHRLYCSSISKAFIKDRFKIPEKAFVELNPNDPKTVHVYDSNDFYWLRITAIGANHCPGSIMFLFEKLNMEGGDIVARILYTGDFRFEFDIPLASLKSLHNGLGEPLEIDEMFLDTTFCSEQYESFPTRHEAEEKIWDQCDKWIKRNGIYKNTRNKHVILLTLPARYGYERILKYVYERSMCKRRVHVNKDKFTEYLCQKELSDSTEPDPALAPWIHACSAYKKGRREQNEPLKKTLPCQPGEFEVCQIKPSAQFFTKAKMDCLSKAGLDRVMSVSQGGNYYRICYSCHSSLTELKRFVQHFKPKKIRPCAIPRNSSRMEVIRILNLFLDEVRPQESSLEPSSQGSSESLQNFSLVPSSPSRSPEMDSLHFIGVNRTSSQKSSISQSLKVNPSEESRVIFDEFMDVDESVNDSSDEDGEKENAGDNYSRIQIIPGIIPEELPGPSKEPAMSCTITSQPLSSYSRRRTFAQSRTEQTYYSMPLQQDNEVSVPKERRFSMPSNMKLPLIKVTPSSPSPDPDDPDYPEFFQDRLYLEHVNKKLEEDQCPSFQSPKVPAADKESQESGENASPVKADEVISGPPNLPMFRGSVRRIKRQQSMFRPEEDRELPSKILKVPLPVTSPADDPVEPKVHTRTVQFNEEVSNIERKDPVVDSTGMNSDEFRIKSTAPTSFEFKADSSVLRENNQKEETGNRTESPILKAGNIVESTILKASQHMESSSSSSNADGPEGSPILKAEKPAESTSFKGNTLVRRSILKGDKPTESTSLKADKPVGSTAPKGDEQRKGKTMKRKSLFCIESKSPKPKFRILAPDSDGEEETQGLDDPSEVKQGEPPETQKTGEESESVVDESTKLENTNTDEFPRKPKLIDEVIVIEDNSLEAGPMTHEACGSMGELSKHESTDIELLTPPKAIKNPGELRLKSSPEIPENTQTSVNSSQETIVLSSSELEIEDVGAEPPADVPRSPTPEIDQLLDDAERQNYPEYIKENLRKVAEIRKNVVQID